MFIGLFLFGASIKAEGLTYWHDQQRLLQIGVLFFALIAVVIQPAQVLPARARVLLAAFAALGAISATRSGSVWAWLEWSWLLAHGALFTLIVQWMQRAPTHATPTVKQTIEKNSLLCISALLIGFVILYTLGTSLRLGVIYAQNMTLDTRLLIHGFSNRRFFGQFATLIWPLLIALSITAALPMRWRRALTISAALLMWTILISQTRGTVYGLIAGITAVVLIGIRSPWFTAAARSVIAGIVIYITLIWIPGWLRGDWGAIEFHLDDAGLSGRGALWQAAWQAMQTHPWLGIGPMAFAALPNVSNAHPHNALLQIAAEWGVPAAMVALGLSLWGLWRLLLTLRAHPHSAWGTGLSVALLSALAQALVDGVVVMPMSQIALIACTALAVAWQQSTIATPPATTSTYAALRLRLTAATLLLTMLSSLALTLQAPTNGLLQLQECKQHARVSESVAPRFWSCGTLPGDQ